ncbi:carnitine O-acetyltransferase-like isoform X2 [Copidosoma floridanum]|nr:carnitine O-acetyltransferase-like isoform X2 [Copidosoma floridanum]
MLRFFTTVSSSVNKPLAYGGVKNIFKKQQVAGITSIQLNKLPLPKQPVPNLEKTAQLYLKSLQPLLNDAEYKNTEKVVDEFIKEGGVGKQLYRKLQERYENTENWMSEWWLQAAYLGYRYPVIVHSSPGTVGPAQKFKSPDDAHRYAAHVIGAVRNYNSMIKSGDIKQEMMRDIPLDMQPYAMILGTHRQPSEGVDNLLHFDNPDHVIIIRNNHFFKLPLTDSVNEEQLAVTIKDIAERSRTPGKPVGILTGNDRDTWVKDYNKLISLGSNNKIVKDLETALFVLCLDKELPKQFFAKKNNESVRGLQSLTGCSSQTNAANRWHDKTVQCIVSYDGFVGMEYEHSPCEGLPISVLHDHIINYVKNKLTQKINIPKEYPKAEHLQFQLDSSIEDAIQKATISVDTLAQDIDLECFLFDEFGSNDIKKWKMSPDSFIQIAMQVTFYRLHKKPPAHYESAALRRFKSARTECIRSTSNESVHFAKLMAYESEPISVKKAAMLAAINAHKNIANEAAAGEGVDRLFFGLKMIARDEKIDLPKFFSDVGYTRSTHFTLTSSQVAYKTESFMCYGPVVPEGYGCCYNPRPSDMFFGCSSFNSCPETSTKGFAETLKQSLRDMKKLAES